MQITEPTSLAELDEAIAYLYAKLKDDRYGNRLTHQQKEFYRKSIDDLLDARITAIKN
jgi:hypothetical protein